MGHFRKAGQRFANAAHLACDVHVPHLIPVARTLATFFLSALVADKGAVVHTVPHPKAHVFGNGEGLVGRGLFVEECGDVYEPGELFVYSVIRSPHPVAVVIGAIHLYKCAVLGRNGIEVAIAVQLRMFLVLIEGLPCALHGAQFFFRGEVACLAIASEFLVKDKSLFLALAKLINHADDVSAEYGFLFRNGGHRIGLCYCRHIMAGTMTLELAIGCIPAVTDRIALGGHIVGVAVVVELLCHIP